jgi:hypothetical protein
MRDRPKSTDPLLDQLPDHWEEWPAFREVLMLHLPPDVADSLRELGRALYEILDHWSLYAPPGSWTAARLGATAAELRFTRQCLEAIAEDRHHADLAEADVGLAERAEAWAIEADELAGEIERSVATAAAEG